MYTIQVYYWTRSFDVKLYEHNNNNDKTNSAGRSIDPIFLFYVLVFCLIGFNMLYIQDKRYITDI